MTPGFIINHLWQSSWFAALAALLAFALRRNAPRVRYWIWLTASLKFLVPWSVLASLGSLVKWPAGHAALVELPVFQNTLAQIAEPISVRSYAAVPIQGSTHWMSFPIWMSFALCLAWALGFVAVAFVRVRAWLRVRAALHAGTPIDLPIPVPVFITVGAMEPGIFGFLRPALILPARLPEQLSPGQLEAVLAHELCHVRRRDNLFAAIHMVVEAIFWFHPLVWWIGKRMVVERELACDEEVLRMGCEPADYVEGILKVCRFYMEFPLPCVSGVSGADVKERLRTILAGHIARELTFGRRLALAAIGVAALTAPVFIGMLNTPRVQAQSPRPAIESVAKPEAARPLTAQIAPAKDNPRPAAPKQSQPVAPPPQFEVASIHEVVDGVHDMGTFRSAGPKAEYHGFSIPALAAEAWNVRPDQIALSPGVSPKDVYPIMEVGRSARIYEIAALAAEGTAPSRDEFRLMLQSLLASRYKLTIHTEKRDKSVYVLGLNGKPALQPNSGDGSCRAIASRTAGGQKIAATHCPMEVLIRALFVDRPVYDETGLTGFYDFEITAALPFQTNDPEAISPFSAVKDLGLKLEAHREPVDTVVIDHVEAPSEN